MGDAHHCSGTPRLQNDLYCIEWDVKPYYTIPFSGKRSSDLLIEEVVPILERTQVGVTLVDFVTLCLIRGMGSWIFPFSDLQVLVTRVDVLLKLMFSQRY